MISNNDTAVYTFGWDTSFGIPVPDANKAIIDKKSSPKSFSYSEASSFSLSGDFNDWQICKGGSGKNIRFSIPLADIILTYASNGNTVKCDSGTAIMEVNMHYVPHAESLADDVKGNPKALVVKHTGTESLPAAVLVSLILDKDVGTVSKAIIEEALKKWLNENLQEFNHIFSVVDLNRMIDQGKWGFVTPNYTSYAFLDGKDLDSSILGVLTMTGDRTGDDLANQISNDIIPQKSQAGFLVSQKRTLSDLVRPAIEQAYPGLNQDNFLLNDAGTKLYLKNGISVDIPKVEHNGSTYQPVLKQLSVESDGQILTLQSYTETEVIPGITAQCTATNWYKIELGTSKNGQTLKFIEAQPADIQHTIHRSEGSIITEVVIAIVAAIALLILTIATDGAALIVGGIIIGLILGADTIVPEIIEAVNTDDSPAIDLLIINAVSPIKWTDSSDFKLDYASLNVSMQLGGDPLFI
ncbi:TULIP family P47-like protein [Marinifilum sp. N1E240]|uniref:TULIP family P47-like protein n=1 Tax=Marinifilum sp. N1E240 TaxID=2608082 RepID=UPI00128BEFB7|nr:TULIP family P47-like protein [Marinifilum sp. N1E240]MPQ49270.1 TULIP family P47-like protein [Marinifilum sp. N1E240]